MNSIKEVVRSSVKVPEFDKHLKKAGGYIGRDVVEITIKMKTRVRKMLIILNTLRLLVLVGKRTKDPTKKHLIWQIFPVDLITGSYIVSNFHLTAR